MAEPLHILVVDDKPDSAMFLSEFLLSRQHRVEISGNGAEALEAVIRRQRANDPYDLIISDISMPGLDGLALLKELRRRRQAVLCALYTAYNEMIPAASQQAQEAGCLTILEKPLELRRIEQLLEEAARRKRGTSMSAKGKDQPFFGTARLVNKPATSTSVNREYDTNSEDNTGALERKGTRVQSSADPFSAAFKLGPPPPPLTPPPPAPAPSPPPAPAPPPPVTTHRQPADPRYQSSSTMPRRSVDSVPKTHTGIIRRTGTDSLRRQSGSPQAPIPTTRTRRGLTGTQAPPAPLLPSTHPSELPELPSADPSSRAVACAYCQKTFMVAVKPAVYTVLCVHCGQMNRIEPL